MQLANAMSGGRGRKQIRRALAPTIACILLFLIFTQIHQFEKYKTTPGDALKRVMAYQSKYRAKNTKFPKKIWQTWKVNPLDFEDRDSTRARTWTKQNTGHRYEVLTDGNDLDYVETHFGPDALNREDIVETYRTLNATIIKADLLRYLVMYIEGGVYADIDVSALRPVSTWIPEEFQESDVDVIISVEIDEPAFVNHRILGQKSQSFCQWTFMAKPRAPVMMRLIEHVLHWLNEISQNQAVPVSQIALNFDEVITGTGPSAFTGAMLAEMTAQTHKRLDWDTFHNLTRPILVGNILVLTVEAFAAGQGHSNSGNHDSPNALVQHHYHASLWPSRHPRYSHPAYGMVEECNWKPDCVKSWDENTGGFDSLPEERKAELIAIKDQADKEKYDKEMVEKEAAIKEETDKKGADLRGKCISYLQGLLPEATPTGGEQAAPTPPPEEQAQPDQTQPVDGEPPAAQTPPPETNADVPPEGQAN